MKAIIAINYPSRNRPAKYGDFIWNPELGCYAWKGRFFDLTSELKEFHECADKVLGFPDCFPRPTVRFIAEDNAVSESTPAESISLLEVPIADLVEVYRIRSREAKCFQLSQARAEKKAKNSAPPVPDLETAPKPELVIA